ncbi:MAG: DUF1566 domain-containing protein [Treponema sp.]|nr:DUF1566 domain-containing protein [Treponema sp.]
MNFPDRSYSKYSNWYFVKTTEELTSAINEISSSNDYSSEKKAVICLMDIVEMSGWNTAISSISEKCTLEKNGFKIVEKRFEVTVSPSITGGTVIASPSGGEADDTITLTVEPSAHYKLESISYTDGSTTSSPILNEATGKYTFIMPNHDVTVTPVFKLYYTVTFQDYNGEQVGDSHGYFEGDELTFDDAKAILADSVPTGRQIVAFKNTTSSPVRVYKKEGEGGFPITFNSTNFSEQNITLRACLDFTYTNDTNYGYEIAPYTFDTQKGTSANPYMMNLYGADTRKQIKITISDYACADPDTGLSITVGGVLSSPFDIEHTGAVFVVKILPTLKTRIPLATLTVTDSATGATKDIYVTVKDNKIGTKAPDSTLAVGDIVFNDGSASAYDDFTETTPMTAEQKAAAVAVIFDVSGGNKKGVGLQQGTGKAWAASDTTGYTTTISTLVATKSSGGNATDASFSFSDPVAADGSGSLANFRAAVGATEGTQLSETDYPAWAFVEGYTTAGITGTSYASGWYMPSIQELCKLYQAKTDVNNALDKIGVTKLDTNYTGRYFSSSQSGSLDTDVWFVNFAAGNLGSCDKNETSYVCVIRQF